MSFSINEIQHQSFNLSDIGAVVEEAKALGSVFDEVHWCSVKRNGNKVAHCLAKKALSAVGVQFWKEAGPPWLHDVIFDDISC